MVLYRERRSTVLISYLSSKPNRRKHRARSSSTGTMTASLLRSASTSGNVSSLSPPRTYYSRPNRTIKRGEHPAGDAVKFNHPAQWAVIVFVGVRGGFRSSIHERVPSVPLALLARATVAHRWQGMLLHGSCLRGHALALSRFIEVTLDPGTHTIPPKASRYFNPFDPSAKIQIECLTNSRLRNGALRYLFSQSCHRATQLRQTIVGRH